MNWLIAGGCGFIGRSLIARIVGGGAAGILVLYDLSLGSHEDIAEIITFVVNRPEHVNILDLIVFPTAQRSAHMVHKEPIPEQG